MTDLERIQQFLEQPSPSQPSPSQPSHRNLEQGCITALAGDASSRRYYRVHDRVDEARALIVTLYPAPFDAGETAVGRLERLLEADPDAALSYANDPLAQIEMTGFLASQGLPVPKLEGVSGPLGIVAFEDLGDVRLSEALEGADADRRHAFYLEAVDLIVKLQAVTQAMRAADVIGAHMSFSEAKLMWELEFFLTHYFEGYRQQPLTARDLEAVRSELEPLCRYLAGLPQVLCHRDYHARNLMVQNETLYLIDYQDGRLGPETYDLVSLLLDPYVPPDALDVDAMLDAYCIARSRPRDAAFREAWQAMAIQRLLKACGTYAFQTARRGSTLFEQYLGPTLKHAVRWMDVQGGMEQTRALIEAR